MKELSQQIVELFNAKQVIMFMSGFVPDLGLHIVQPFVHMATNHNIRTFQRRPLVSTEQLHAGCVLEVCVPCSNATVLYN